MRGPLRSGRRDRATTSGIRRDTAWALTRRRCAPSMPLGTARSLAAARPHSPCGQSPQSAVIRYCRMARRFRCGPAVAPSGRLPAPDLVRRAPPPGSTVSARHAAPAWSCRLLAEVVGAWQQAKGGDAWWAAGGRAGPGRSASSPERGSTRAAAAPAGPGPTTPSVHPADLRLVLPGVPRPRSAVLQPRRPAVPGARHRAAGGGAGPAVVGQGDGQAPHCAGRGVAMAVTAGGRRRGEQLGWCHAVMDRLPGPAGPHRRWRRVVSTRSGR